MPNTCSGHSKAVDRRGPAYTDGVKTDADSDRKVASIEDDHTPRECRGPRETAGTLECCCRNEPLENQALQGETRSKRCRIMLLYHCRGIRRKINKATATALTTGRGTSTTETYLFTVLEATAKGRVLAALLSPEAPLPSLHLQGEPWCLSVFLYGRQSYSIRP